MKIRYDQRVDALTVIFKEQSGASERRDREQTSLDSRCDLAVDSRYAV